MVVGMRFPSPSAILVVAAGEDDLAAGGSDPPEPMTGGASPWLIKFRISKNNLLNKNLNSHGHVGPALIIDLLSEI